MTTQCEKAFEEWQESKLHETIGSIKEVWEAAAKWRQEFDAKICETQVAELRHDSSEAHIAAYACAKKLYEKIRKAE